MKKAVALMVLLSLGAASSQATMVDTAKECATKVAQNSVALKDATVTTVTSHYKFLSGMAVVGTLLTLYKVNADFRGWVNDMVGLSNDVDGEPEQA